MNIIAVDDEYHALKILERSISQAAPGNPVSGFKSAEEALEYAAEHPVDVAFLDIKMRGMHGLALAKELKKLRPEINIVFVTGYSEYAVDAYRLHASGYVTKPVSAESVRLELENLRNPPGPADSGIRIRTFGNFQITVDGEPVLFKRSKSKEILAYLVDRCGAGVTNKGLASVLWEDDPYTRSHQHQIQNNIAAMIADLTSAGAGEIIIRKYNHLAVDPDKVDCDLFRLRNGDPQALNDYMGEYMAEYSWAEPTAALLEERYLHG